MSEIHPHRTRTLWLTGVLHAFTHLYHVALLPLYLLIQKDPVLGLETVDQATFLVTVLMLSYFLPSYAMGVMADRFSKKKLLAWGLGINAAGFIGLSFATTFGGAVAWMVISGFGGSFFHPSATSLIARLYSEKTGRALGLLGIGASAGFFLGPIYTGWRGAAAGWRTPVMEIGIVGIVTALLFYILADDEPPHAEGPVERQIVPMFPRGGLWILFLVAAFAFSMRDFVGSTMGSLGSLFLQKAQGLDAGGTGKILSVIFLASAVSNPLFGHLSDKRQGLSISMALIIAGVMVALFPHFPPKWSAAGLAIYGFFFMATYPMVEAALMGSVPHAVRGRVFGLFITIGGFIGNLAHWAAGAWVKHLGPGAAEPEKYHGAYAVLALLVLLSLVGLPSLRALRKREQPALARG